jgi:HK97 gp10 family phage protein
MEITVEVQGLKGVEAALEDAGPKLAKRALRKALRAGGQLMVDAAKARAPLLKEATKRRKPGDLRDSIGMKVALSAKQESGTVSVGPMRDRSKGKDSPGIWGMFVEFGSVHGAAQPFMRPGFDYSSQPALEAFTEVIREGVETLDK